MSTSTLRRALPVLTLLLTLTLALAACGGDDPEPAGDADASSVEDASGSATPSADASAGEDGDDGTDQADDPDGTGYPVTVAHDGGEATIEEEPTAIVSLSPTATEVLFAIDAGDQVVAADEFSTYPAEAPTTELSGLEPNVEAILGYEPDLVIASFDPGELVSSMDEVGVPVLLYGSAPSLDAAYVQMTALGDATGHPDEAAALVEDVRTQLDEIAAGADGDGVTYYHELSSDLFTATSTTFVGEVYGLFGMENVADPADEDGAAFGFPQLSTEFLVDADPDMVFLACTEFCGETAETFAEREGFGDLTAVENGDVVELDDDVASRWGPRVVELASSVADALAARG